MSKRWVVGLVFMGLVSHLGGCAAATVDDESSDELQAADALTGSYPVGTEFFTRVDANQRKGPSTSHAIITTLPAGTRVVSASAKPQNGWYGVTSTAGTGWIRGDLLTRTTSGVGGGTAPSAGTISAAGRQQMADVLAFAEAHHRGYSGGMCFQYVWGYLTSSGYGKLDNWNDAPDMPSAEARNFAEYMNANGNAAKWGLQRLPLNNPYDAPAGAVVVVAAGSPGTAHPTAGDIAIATGTGRFVNDGPNMGYGGSRQAFINGGGVVLGIYAPF